MKITGIRLTIRHLQDALAEVGVQRVKTEGEILGLVQKTHCNVLAADEVQFFGSFDGEIFFEGDFVSLVLHLADVLVVLFYLHIFLDFHIKSQNFLYVFL